MGGACWGPLPHCCLLGAEQKQGRRQQSIRLSPVTIAACLLERRWCMCAHAFPNQAETIDPSADSVLPPSLPPPTRLLFIHSLAYSSLPPLPLPGSRWAYARASRDPSGPATWAAPTTLGCVPPWRGGGGGVSRGGWKESSLDTWVPWEGIPSGSDGGAQFDFMPSRPLKAPPSPAAPSLQESVNQAARFMDAGGARVPDCLLLVGWEW